MSKKSIKYSVMFLFVLVIVYLYFIPEEYIDKLLNPCEYWKNEIRIKKETLKILEQLIINTHKELNVNHQVEIKKIEQKYNSYGIHKDSAKNIAIEFYNNKINSQIEFIRKCKESILKTQIEIKKANNEFNLLVEKGKCK